MRADTLVGLCVERSLEMVVGIVGILKAGGAYVPLDPGYPQERLEYMIGDSAPAVLLTQESVEDRLPPIQVPRLRLDADWGELEKYSTDNLGREEVGLTPEHLAYVIYTSGSTGQPKGVMNAHGSRELVYGNGCRDSMQRGRHAAGGDGRFILISRCWSCCGL